MSYHTVAWTASLGAVTDSDLTPVADNIMLVQNSHFVPQSPLGLIWAAVLGVTVTLCRIATPKTRQITRPVIRPLIPAVIPSDLPSVWDLGSNPFQLSALEEIQMLISESAVGPNQLTVLAGLSAGIEPAPQGDVYRLRGTSTTAAVANKWSAITMTWVDSLPQGQYACIGIEHQSTNAQAARLIFQGQQFRPGSLSVTALGNRQATPFSLHKYGILGRFLQTALPLVEVLANGADATHEVYLDLIRIG